MSNGSFEGKLHGFRRTQDGVVISYVVHPNDVSAAMATAALGTRYMIGFAEIGDDGKPVKARSSGVGPSAHNGLVAGSKPAASTNAKERQPFGTLALSAQAGIRCGDDEFQAFLRAVHNAGVTDQNTAAAEIRFLTSVQSRGDYNTDSAAAERWTALETQFQAWKTDKRYAGAIHQ